MKKKVLLSGFLFLFCFAFVQAQWRQSLSGQTSLIRNLSAVEDTVVWALDQSGMAISLSTDGGATWIVKSLPSFMTMGGVVSISAVSATTAYVIVSSTDLKGVYKTTDGGGTWTRQASAFNVDSPWPDFVYFWNKNDGIAVGDPIGNTFEIYVTANGGDLWNRVPASSIPLSNLYEYSYGSNDVYRILGNSIYFYTSQGRLFRSFDKGYTWSSVSTPVTNGNYMSFAFKDVDHGLCALSSVTNDYYELYTTSDGGGNWEPIANADSVARLHYSPLQEVYFSANYHHGLKYSRDGGRTWITQPSLHEVGLSDMAFFPSGKIVAGGWSYVYRTSDFENQNMYVSDIRIKNVNTIDVSYSEDPDPETAQTTVNYSVGSIDSGFKPIKINSAIQDPIDKRVVHLLLDANIPQDTIKVYVMDVKDNRGKDGFTMINQAPSSSKVIYNLAMGIAPASSFRLDVYLDPVSRCLYVTGSASPGEVEIADMNGRILLSEQLVSGKIDVSRLSPGIYLLRLKNEKGATVRKFAVK